MIYVRLLVLFESFISTIAFIGHFLSTINFLWSSCFNDSILWMYSFYLTLSKLWLKSCNSFYLKQQYNFFKTMSHFSFVESFPALHILLASFQHSKIHQKTFFVHILLLQIIYILIQ